MVANVLRSISIYAYIALSHRWYLLIVSGFVHCNGWRHITPPSTPLYITPVAYAFIDPLYPLRSVTTSEDVRQPVSPRDLRRFGLSLSSCLVFFHSSQTSSVQRGRICCVWPSLRPAEFHWIFNGRLQVFPVVHVWLCPPYHVHSTMERKN